MNTRLPAAALFTAMLTFASTASSQEAPAEDIVQLNEDGIAAFQSGNFEEAASKFRRAYELQPENTLKKNEAVAWFKAQKCAEATTAAAEFLALPGTDELSQTEARAVAVTCNIQLSEAALTAGNLDEAQSRVEAAKASGPVEQDQAKIADLETRIADKQKEAAAAAQAEADRRAKEDAARLAAQKSAEQSTGSGGSNTLGVALMGTGGGLILTGLIYHSVMAFSVAPKFRDAAEAGADRAEYDKLGKSLETANWIVPTLYALGAATAGVGVYFWMTGSSSTEASASATAGRDLGVTFSWRF